jgi:glyoxylase-like metal-dependent hydrolase (beta-lactamase superfamily II)
VIYLFMRHDISPMITNPDFKNMCLTCGTRYAEEAPSTCAICSDERQYVPSTGQKWTSYNEQSLTHTIRFGRPLANVYNLRISPTFGIAQRAHLIVLRGGNILWDCLPFLDETTVAFIRAEGGLKGIAISHPHYYSLMADWAETFDCPIYLHKADNEWVMDTTDRIQFFNGDKHVLWDGMELIHTGGHFAGSTILYAPSIGDKGSVFVGDTLQIALSRQFISMMYSYPNMIPLPLREIEDISKVVMPLHFDGMYGAFEWQDIHIGAKEIFKHSVNRYRKVLASHRL